MVIQLTYGYKYKVAVFKVSMHKTVWSGIGSRGPHCSYATAYAMSCNGSINVLKLQEARIPLFVTSFAMQQ